MSTVDDLVTWLRARLDEREFKAKGALPGPWGVEEYTYETVVATGGGQVVATVEGLRDGWHIADNDPKFVLADIAAKRRKIDWCLEVIGDRDLSRYGEFGALKDDPDALAVTLAVETLKLLALPFSDRPGYLDTWRP